MGSTDEFEPPWWPEQRAGRRRDPLSRDEIVEVALRVVDADGPDALTVRRLGDELGTGSATLYWHIRSKDDLVEMLYDRVVGDIRLPDDDGRPWTDRLSDLARDAYRVLGAHPGVVRLSIGHVPMGPNMLRLIDWLLGLLTGAGIDGREAAYVGDVLGRYLDASVLDKVAPAGSADLAAVGEHLARLPADRYPHLAALGPVAAEGSPDERFEFGLALLVGGLANR